MDIIDKIVYVRKQRGISQQKLSEMTGILQPVIARVESKRSSPTIDFVSKVLNALDLELNIVDSFESPKEIKKIISGLSHRRINVGRSGDKVFVFGERYLLKISDNKNRLQLEKDKNEWLNKYLKGPLNINYIEDDWNGYYLREYLKGHTLIEEQYLKDPIRLIKILKNVKNILRSLDDVDCPFLSLNNKGNDFVHGDLCLPNIIVDDHDNFLGFIDIDNSGKGDKQYDYCSLLWSFEYNLKTSKYNDVLLNELNIYIDQVEYARYTVFDTLNREIN